MKIAMIGQKGLPARYGGVEKHVHDLSTRLVKAGPSTELGAGHEVTVYARQWYTPKEMKEYEGVKIRHLPSIHTKHLDTISHTFLATVDAIFKKYDVIHYHGIGPALLSWMPRIFARKSMVVVTFHSIDRYDQKWGRLAKLALRLAEKCACYFPHKTIAISRGLQKYCLNEFYRDTIYIPNGISIPEINAETDEIKKFALKKQQYFIMVSRLIPTKGAHILIQAFNQLKKNNPENEAVRKLKLAIVGGAVYTNSYVKELHQLASLNNDIIFTDFQTGEALHQLYGNALALVHPSFNEGLPITVLEGMSYGLPALVSDINEHHELISDVDFIFKENNADDLEKKMLKFINLSAEKKQRAGQANFKFVSEHYLWENIVPQILRVYQNPDPMPIISSLPS